MPLLDRSGIIEESYLRAPSEGIAASHRLVPWADVAAALASRGPGQRIGVDIPNTLPSTDVAPLLRQLDLIAIGFPTFSDGRGFSLARQLRRIGFAGRLRAVGPLIADQFAYVLACGFDEAEVPEAIIARQPVEHWLTALVSITRTYQRGYGDGANILEQRRRARLAAGGGRP